MSKPKKPKRYSNELLRRVDAQIPGPILEAMTRLGWNALGIYELVSEEIKRERGSDAR